jgi:Ca2+-binding EF-hand superfamily protein
MIALKEWALAALAGLVLTEGLVIAGCTTTPFGGASDFDRTFIGAAQTWDLDKNGSVSCDEWKRYGTTSLHEADANGDGMLDAQEFAVLSKGDRLFEVANLSYYDANSDGRVSADELTGKPNLAFKLLDKNNDCQIDRTETVQIVGNEKPKEKAKDIDQNIPKPGGH